MSTATPQHYDPARDPWVVLPPKLDSTEASELRRLEQTIEAGLQTFLEVGRALLEVRDRKLYRAEHRSFEAYCRDRWSFSDRRARQIISAADTASVLHDQTGTFVPNEAQARELAPLINDQDGLRTVWEQVETHDGPVTAKVIRDCVRQYRNRDSHSDYDRAVRSSNEKMREQAGQRTEDEYGLPPLGNQANISAPPDPGRLEKFIRRAEDSIDHLDSATKQSFMVQIGALERIISSAEDNAVVKREALSALNSVAEIGTALRREVEKVEETRRSATP